MRIGTAFVLFTFQLWQVTKFGVSCRVSQLVVFISCMGEPQGYTF